MRTSLWVRREEPELRLVERVGRRLKVFPVDDLQPAERRAASALVRLQEKRGTVRA